MKRSLILHVPVIHQGYLDLFEKYQDQIGIIYLLDYELTEKLSGIKSDIASIDPKKAAELLRTLGFEAVEIITENELKKLSEAKLLLINDQVGRTLQKKYFPKSDAELINVFLRWDRDKVFSDENFVGEQSKLESDQKMMKLAYQEAEKSGDWWRQVGLIMVKDGEIAMKTHNQALPDEHISYQLGAVRDLMEVGEKPELANYIHAEQVLIAEAARKGIEIENCEIYLTHFPCPVCAKLLAVAKPKIIYFAEGSSNLLGEEIIKSRGCSLIKVVLD